MLEWLPPENIRVSYEKLRKILRRRRMTISAFGKNAGISRADLYMMQIDEMMSPEGEFNACHYLKLDCADIRDITIPDPNNPEEVVFYPGNKTPEEWLTPADKASRKKQEE